MRARTRDAKNYTKFMLRLPEELHRYLAESAKVTSRSLNYECILRLRASIQLDRLLDVENSEERLLGLEKMRRRLRDFRLVEDED